MSIYIFTKKSSHVGFLSKIIPYLFKLRIYLIGKIRVKLIINYYATVSNKIIIFIRKLNSHIITCQTSQESFYNFLMTSYKNND